MTYTTTKCPHCGYKTRNRETGVPEVQLGQTILNCPNCGNIIIDPINTEWEFMADYEKRKFTATSIQRNNIVASIIKIIIAIVFFVGSITTADAFYIIIGIVIAVWLVIDSIYSIIKDNDALENGVLDKAIEESILRTSNKTYVSFLEKYYEGKRIYHKDPRRDEIIEKNKNNIDKNFDNYIKKNLKEEKEIKKSKRDTNQINI